MEILFESFRVWFRIQWYQYVIGSFLDIIIPTINKNKFTLIEIQILKGYKNIPNFAPQQSSYVGF